VRACTPASGVYHVELILDPIAEAVRLAIESSCATASATRAC
jgi:hypothetical protein